MCQLSCLTGTAITGAMLVLAAFPRPMAAQSPPRSGTESTPALQTATKGNPSTQGEKAARQEPAPTTAVLPCRVELLDDDAAWEKLPAVEQTAGRRLPHWARALVGALPRTTAAMLHLDYLYRTSAAIEPKLRARMRWVAATANRCEYAQQYARADLLRAGAAARDIQELETGLAELPPAERAALSFARKMTLAASTVTDDEMQRISTTQAAA
jgi:alkylhydroperoxidase family enzyme